MAARSSDKALGMDRPIARRDLLHGAALLGLDLAAGGMLSACAPIGARLGVNTEPSPGYPPSLTGMRGSQPGSFEVAHGLRDGQQWPDGEEIGEHFDLVVVGAGISGLAAAYFYRDKAGADRRILILDNHDDFGGHARRNEYTLDSTLQLINGGTFEIDSPRPYSATAEGLLHALGVDVDSLARQIEHPERYATLGLGRAVFFDRDTFGADHLVAGEGERSWANFLARAPLSPKARDDLSQIEEGEIDYLPGLSAEQKKEHLSKISYLAYLRDIVRADPAVLAFYQAHTHNWWAVGIDAVSALDCWALEAKGFQGLRLPEGAILHMGYTPFGFASTGGSKRLHFPDGNATIARLLVRSLIPAVSHSRSVEDIVTDRFDYARLDQADAPVKMRLNSTVVRVANQFGGEARSRVALDYVQNGRCRRVHASTCVLACYNAVIPWICPELPNEQKAALHSRVRSPLVYTSVALKNWQPFVRLRASEIYAPGCYFTSVYLNPTIEIGAYNTSISPKQPTLVQLIRTPCRPGLPEKDQNRAGRAELLATSFEVFERNVRDQLSRMLGDGGFDPASDILGITVNRWPHGYAAEFNPLFDAELSPEQQPHVVGRQRRGRIAIANSDAGGGAYTDVAIDQAARAVDELLQLPA